MSIRIIDQHADHSAQNPPPDDQWGIQPTEVRVTVSVSTPDGHTCVLRGDSSGGSFEALTFCAHEPARTAAPQAFSPGEFRNFVEMPSLSWGLRASAGTFKVGTGLERTVCRLAARWALTAVAALVRGAREQQGGAAYPDATGVLQFR